MTFEPPLSMRVQQVEPFRVMDIVARANALEAAGTSIIHLEVGQPGTPAPALARSALSAALGASQPLGYTESLGIPALRSGIAAMYKSRYKVDVPAERVIITSGSSGAFILAFTALFDAGDRVALGEPGYPSYRSILKALSVEPVGLPTTAAARYQPTPADLAAAPPGVKGLIVASPSNPTGTILGRAELAALAAAAEARGMALISDEIYHGICYPGAPQAVCALEVSDRCYVINSFSKFFSMTGYRVGWLVVPSSHVRAIERLAQNLFICAPHASQVAALAALGADEELAANLRVYAANRALMLEHLPRVGFPSFAPPDGAFFVYVELAAELGGSAALCDELLSEAGVAATPGLDFDTQRGGATLRFSYARSTADISEGMRRLGAWWARRLAREGGR
jgi:aspartate/methionine/tyrosine aminotransferase